MLSCEVQSRRGHEVHLAFGPIYGPEGSMLERVRGFRTDDGRRIETHVVEHLVREVRPRDDWRALGELRALIRELRPDVVHTHSSKAGVLGRVAAWGVGKELARGASAGRTLANQAATGEGGENGANVAGGGSRAAPGGPAGIAGRRHGSGGAPGIVHTIHGPPFMPVEGGVSRRVKIRLNNEMYALAERFAAKRCHVIVSVADAMTRQFLERGIGRPAQYVTVRSGMELDRYLRPAPGETREEVRRDLGLGEGDLVIGTVARLAEHKGHDDLLAALGDELRMHRHWKLLWVGDGWWRERLLRRVRDLGLERQVVLTGLVPPQRVAGCIRAMDILAHPSYREGLPRTVPQALLCGVVPVAYDVDGTGEVCVEGHTGRLVDVGDVERLRVAIVELAENELLRRRLAERGRIECEGNFGAEKMVDELEAVYGRALAMARGGPGGRRAGGGPG